MNRYILEHNFRKFVEKKYHFLNSVFLGIALESKSGKFIYDFTDHIYSQVKGAAHPFDIINSYFPEETDEDRIADFLFNAIQYIERQVVLYDAVEDAAFEKINNLDGPNSLQFVISNAVSNGLSDEIRECVETQRVRIVLTAHPTQFYPGTILGIITELNRAIRKNDLETISALLGQLAYTPFFKKSKPSPYDEALSHIWFLDNVLYDAILDIHKTVQETLPGESGRLANPKLIELGFWPGGDRDGNPFVTAETTRKVADRLRISILQKYYDGIRALKRKLTFRPVYDRLRDYETRLLDSILSGGAPAISCRDLLEGLEEIKVMLEEKFSGLYVRETCDLIHSIQVFGCHFASLDIRQDSRVHRKVAEELLGQEGSAEEYTSLPPEEGTDFLLGREHLCPPEKCSEMTRETIASIKEIENIQKLNGPEGCGRYIISNCSSETNIYELMFLFTTGGWKLDDIKVDIVPLFETIDDLEHAASIMERLYGSRYYREHLKNRDNRQTIMLGFSDGTKDGGYLTANWSIYKAKETLTAVSRKHDIQVTFFDGRGGPAARGGGKTHNFYAAHGRSIENRNIQLTIQGQTVSSNFGTTMSARYNLEQLLSAGFKNRLYESYNADFIPEDRILMEKLSRVSCKAYNDLKNNSMFIPYLLSKTALPYYGMTNVGSRPDKRKSPGGFSFGDLRAIPFVGAWTLNKQNIPGFFGLGHALEEIHNKNREDIPGLYRRSIFFRTLVQNSMMVLKKTNFPITSYLRRDREFGEFWERLEGEYSRTEGEILSVSGVSHLMESNPKDRMSVELRERIILPLAVIHQYALCRLQELDEETELYDTYRHMVVRSSYGIINAGRNSA